VTTGREQKRNRGGNRYGHKEPKKTDSSNRTMSHGDEYSAIRGAATT